MKQIVQFVVAIQGFSLCSIRVYPYFQQYITLLIDSSVISKNELISKRGVLPATCLCEGSPPKLNIPPYPSQPLPFLLFPTPTHTSPYAYSPTPPPPVPSPPHSILTPTPSLPHPASSYPIPPYPTPFSLNTIYDLEFSVILRAQGPTSLTFGWTIIWKDKPKGRHVKGSLYNL